MANNFILTWVAPTEHGVDTFDTDLDIYEETDGLKTTASRYTSDPIRESVMKIQGNCWTLGDGQTLGSLYLGDSIVAAGEGVYKDFAVTAELRYKFSCLYKTSAGIFAIILYDQTNGAVINTVDKSDTSWLQYDASITIPSDCLIVRVKFVQKNGSYRSGPFYIDNVSLNGNVLMSDPDVYERASQRVGSFHQTLSGRRVYDLRAIHYTFNLKWNYCNSAQYEAFREVFFNNEVLYFDDGDVPPLLEREIVYNTAIYNYVGITNPSSTHKAYMANSASLPSSKGDFETSEFTTGDYNAIDENDSNYVETSNPTAGNYLYHKFLIKSTIAQSDVKRFRVKVAALSDDNSPQNLDGCLLYAWNGSGWVELVRSSNSAKADLTYSTSESAIASQFMDASDSYVRLLLRSRNARSGSNNLNLRTYFVDIELNEGMDLTIELSHKTILDPVTGDVFWVRNLTTGETLVLDDDYTIAADRRSVTVSSGVSSGDEIEVKYNRYFEVMFANLPEEWLSGDTDNERIRSIRIVLQTLSESR